MLKIDAKLQLYDASSEAEILSGQPDLVLDCIDNIDAKVTNRCCFALLCFGVKGFVAVINVILHARCNTTCLQSEERLSGQ
jgi:molybdopterin/thiamine biosynthesis adenylyltransferase